MLSDVTAAEVQEAPDRVRELHPYEVPEILTMVAEGGAVPWVLLLPLWGLAFGPLVTMYQTAVSKQVEEAKDVATSVQSSVFNLSIMIATWVGGLLLGRSPRSGV